MAKIQSVWAIDIGQSALKALKLVPGDDPEKLTAEAFDFVEYPKILSQPDADAEELVREALTTFLERNEVKGSRVAIGVSGQAGLVKFIKLPPVEKKRIPDIVKFEARQQIPFALEEVIWDYQQIGGDDEDGDDEGFAMAEVGLFAMKRDQIARAIMPLKAAGIEVDIVQMGPIALYNFAVFDHSLAQRDAGGSVVYLDIGADNTDLIITDGKRIWQRNVPIGGNHFTRALTKELKLTFAKAEHLKRNATKAPDPRAVFTAMRGIFNDFASEVNRSIGFYSSVNRTAKIAKVVGLGNGFKLPGLQKFLQQNLSNEVEKLESFQRIVGEEVTTAPQFIENLPSFAVAYGLAVQGLDRGPLKTNLLPPEIEQVRMIRRKKPWALAAAALLMLGFSAMYMSDYHAYAKATSDAFKSAVESANNAKKEGDRFKSEYETASKAFKDELEVGKALVDEEGSSTNWPFLLKLVSAALPHPEQELAQRLKLEAEEVANDPKFVNLLGILRVHVDGIVPRYRSDVKTWFEDTGHLDEAAKSSMHPFDRDTAPSGEGWVIQVLGHHYNPSPLKRKDLTAEEKKQALGPIPYIQDEILPRFWSARFRQLGVHHAALTWFMPDPEWTSTKAAKSSGSGADLLAREEPKVEASTEGGAGGAAGDMGKMMMMGGGMMGAGMGKGGGYGSMPGGADMQRMMMGGGMMGGYGSTGGSDQEKEVKTLTRTDFKIEFIWQPPDPKAEPKSLEDINKELIAAVKTKGAPKLLDEDALAKASLAKSAKAVDAQLKKIEAAVGGAPAAGAPAAGAATPGTPPAAGAPPAPGTPPAAGAPPAPGAAPK